MSPHPQGRKEERGWGLGRNGRWRPGDKGLSVTSKGKRTRVRLVEPLGSVFPLWT